MTKICNKCRWHDAEGARCTCPTLPPLWGELIQPTLANYSEFKPVADICTRDNLRNGTAKQLGAYMLAQQREYCPAFSDMSHELCEGCINFVEGIDDDPDVCLAEPTDDDITADDRQVVTRCALYRSK